MRYALALLEAWLGLDQEVYRDRIHLRSVLQASLDPVEPPWLAWYVLTDLSVCLRTTDDWSADGRGAQAGVAVLEIRLGLSGVVYSDRESLLILLREGALGREKPPLQAWVLTELASGLLSIRKPGAGAMLLECWLGLPHELGVDAGAMPGDLSRPPLAEVSPDEAAGLLVTLADCWQVLGADYAARAAALLTGWEPFDRLVSGPVVEENPLRALTPNTQARLLRCLAFALSFGHPGQPNEAAGRIASWLSHRPADFATAPRLREVAIENRLALACGWVLAAGSDHPDALPTCAAIAQVVADVTDRSLLPPGGRRDFIRLIREAGPLLWTVALERARWQDGAHSPDARELHWRALAWAEQFENRLLRERMLDVDVGGEMVAPLSGEAIRWPLQHVREPPEGVLLGGYLPRSGAHRLRVRCRPPGTCSSRGRVGHRYTSCIASAARTAAPTISCRRAGPAPYPGRGRLASHPVRVGPNAVLVAGPGRPCRCRDSGLGPEHSGCRTAVMAG